jgi:hypothetical protein
MVSALACGIKPSDHIVSELTDTSTRLPHCVATYETNVSTHDSLSVRSAKLFVLITSHSKPTVTATRLIDRSLITRDLTQRARTSGSSKISGTAIASDFARQRFLVKIMTIRLIKQGEAPEKEEKPAQLSLEARLLLTTQGWIDEFKARKATNQQSLAVALRRI